MRQTMTPGSLDQFSMLHRCERVPLRFQSRSARPSIQRTLRNRLANMLSFGLRLRMWWKKLEITRARIVKVETAASWDGTGVSCARVTSARLREIRWGG